MSHTSVPIQDSRVKPVVVYDGGCGFCQKGIKRIQARDRGDIFEYCPRQDPTLEQRFPAITEGDFNTGMRLIEPGGRIHVGADAVYAIARRLPYWRWLAWLYRVPGIHAALRLAYRWVAANRYRLAEPCPVNPPGDESRTEST